MKLSQARILLQVSAVGALVGLAGCGTFTAESSLNTVLPEGDAFSQALAREYQQRADSEAYQDGNWTDAVLFIERMHASAAGEVVPPLNPDDFFVGSYRAELEEGRAALIRALGPDGGIRDRARACAKAQRYYDGWVEQASDNKWGEGGSYFGGPGGDVQPAWTMAERAAFHEYLAACQPPPPPPVIEEVEEAIEEVSEEPVDEAIEDVAEEQMIVGEAAAEETFDENAEEEVVAEDVVEVQMPEPESIAGDYVVYFAFDKSDLTPEARTVIREVVSLIYGADTYSVDIVGHTDTMGSVAYNIALGQRRANAVEEFLLDQGVSQQTLFTSSRGEGELAVPTRDQVREARNRRAVITVVGEIN